MSKKGYLREEMKYKSVPQEKRKTKCTLSNNKKKIKMRKSQHINEQTLIKETILSRMSECDQRQNIKFEDQTMKVRVNIYFSRQYKLSMMLPSCMKIKELQQLIGCYVKMHLKHRPSVNHVYTGLIAMINDNENKKRQIKECYEKRQQKAIACCDVVGFIVDSILLAQKRREDQCNNNIRYNNSHHNIQGTLKQLVVAHRQIDRIQRGKSIIQSQQSLMNKEDIYEVNVAVRYDLVKVDNYDNLHQQQQTRIQQRQQNEQSKERYQEQNDSVQVDIQINPNQQIVSDNNNNNNRKLITLNPYYQQQLLFTCTPKQSIKNKNSNKNNTNKEHELSEISKLMRWLNCSQLVDWLVLYNQITDYYYHSQNNNNIFVNQIGWSYFHNNRRRKQFFKQNEDYQLQKKRQFKVYPLRLRQSQQLYLLVVMDWQELSYQQINKKIILINSLFVTKDHLPFTHRLKQIYCFTNNQDNQDNQDNKDNHSNSNSYKDINNNNNSDCKDDKEVNKCIIVMQVCHLRRVKLFSYLRQLMNSKRIKNINPIHMQQQYQQMMLKGRFSVVLAKLKKLLQELSRMNRDEDTTILHNNNIINNNNNLIKEHSLLSMFNVQLSHNSSSSIQFYDYSQPNINLLIDSTQLLNRIQNNYNAQKSPSYSNQHPFYHNNKYPHNYHLKHNYGRKRSTRTQTTNQILSNEQNNNNINNNNSKNNSNKNEDLMIYYSTLYHQIKSIITDSASINASTKQHLSQTLKHFLLPQHQNSKYFNLQIQQQHNKLFSHLSKNQQNTTTFIDHLHQQTQLYLSNQSPQYQSNTIQQLINSNTIQIKSAQYQLTLLTQSIQINQSSLNIYHSYQYPILYHFLPNQHINIHSKQTTLKKHHHINLNKIQQKHYHIHHQSPQRHTQKHINPQVNHNNNINHIKQKNHHLNHRTKSNKNKKPTKQKSKSINNSNPSYSFEVSLLPTKTKSTIKK